MKRLDLAYDRAKFWEDYWRKHGTDHAHFEDLDMYPIKMTLRHVTSGDRILECGCGAGRVVRHLNANGYDVVGLEYDIRALEGLRAVNGSLKLVAGDGVRLPFPDDSFDAALAFGLVGALGTGTAAALGELRRVVRPGRRIVMSVMLANWARRFQKLLNRVTARQEPEFYAWMDSEAGWTNYFGTFGLRVIDADPMVSRYNVFYWTPFLRAKETTDLTLARVKDSEYKLNAIGSALWALHRDVARNSLAAAMTFALVNDK